MELAEKNSTVQNLIIWGPDMLNILKHYPNLHKVSLGCVTLPTFFEINVVVKHIQSP